MPLRLYPARDFKIMPWKNGGGSTAEILIQPPESDLQTFDWRISLATLESSGPFSTFPGYDRSIAQLSGTPMRLEHKEAPPQELKPEEPYTFQGEWTTQGIVRGGPVRDFNLMSRRSHIRSELLRQTISGTIALTLASENVIYLLDGTLQAEGRKLAPGDALYATEMNELLMKGEGHFLWARIWLRS